MREGHEPPCSAKLIVRVRFALARRTAFLVSWGGVGVRVSGYCLTLKHGCRRTSRGPEQQGVGALADRGILSGLMIKRPSGRYLHEAAASRNALTCH